MCIWDCVKTLVKVLVKVVDLVYIVQSCKSVNFGSTMKWRWGDCFTIDFFQCSYHNFDVTTIIE